MCRWKNACVSWEICPLIAPTKLFFRSMKNLNSDCLVKSAILLQKIAIIFLPAKFSDNKVCAATTQINSAINHSFFTISAIDCTPKFIANGYLQLNSWPSLKIYFFKHFYIRIRFVEDANYSLLIPQRRSRCSQMLFKIGVLKNSQY